MRGSIGLTIVLVAVLGGAARVECDELVRSRFESGTEGWTLWANGDTHARHKDGVLYGREGKGHVGWYFDAPDKFLVGARYAYGGTLRYEQRVGRERGDNVKRDVFSSRRR